MGESITIIAPSPADSLRGPPITLIPVPPTRVTVETVAGEKRYRVQEAGGDFIFDASDIIHQRVVNLLDPYGRGSGLGRAVADEIETDEYVAKHAKSYYYNSTVPEFIGVLKGASEQKVREFGAAFDEKHRGFRRHWRPAWINQEIQIEQLTANLDDEQIQRLRKLAFDTIRWVYGVPPEVMGVVENSNRATIQAAKDMMATFVVEPRLRKRRAMWNKLAERIWGVQVDFVSPVPREFDRRDEIMSRHPYAFTRNEIRREAGFDAVSDGNVYLVPVNLSAEPANDGDISPSISGDTERILVLVSEDRDDTDAA